MQGQLKKQSCLISYHRVWSPKLAGIKLAGVLALHFYVELAVTGYLRKSKVCACGIDTV